MLIDQQIPDYAYILRAITGSQAKVNEQVLESSFILTPSVLIERWLDVELLKAATLTIDQLQPLLDLQPELILLGTGEQQVFPPARTLAFCLSQGIGIEVMSNAAAARTYHILANESRNVAAGFILGSSD